MPDVPILRPIAEPLAIASIELADLARLSDGLQTAIARLAKVAGTPPHELMMDCQAADLLSQRLEGLSAFLSALSAAAPANLLVDVAEAAVEMSLSEQARRFAGPGPAPAAPDPAAGDCCLFDA